MLEDALTFLEDWLEKYQPEGTMFERFLWVFWGLWVLLVFVALARVIEFRLGMARERRRWGDGSGVQRPAAVIVPIKGVTARHTAAFFQSLIEQKYESYRLLVAVESMDDPAAEWLMEQFGISMTYPAWLPPEDSAGLQEVRLIVAGQAEDHGQKVWNELAAFEHLEDTDEVIVFVDADIVCPPDWLARLTAPINRGTHDPATTYRWLVPSRARLSNQFASVINASVTTQGGKPRESMPWGGSMAISRSAFEDLDVPGLFRGSLNDDLRLGKEAKREGYRLGFVRSLVRPTEIDFTWGQFFEFARRQYFQVRVYAPITYFWVNVIFLLYLTALGSAIAAVAMGYLFAWVPLILVTLFDQVRAMTRESIYRRLFGSDRNTYRRIAATSWLEHFLTPVWMLLHGLIIFSTWFMARVTWGGIRYEVKGPDRTRVLARSPRTVMGEASMVGDLALPDGGMIAALEFEGAEDSWEEAAGDEEEWVEEEWVEEEVWEEVEVLEGEETEETEEFAEAEEDWGEQEEWVEEEAAEVGSTVDPTEPIDVAALGFVPREPAEEAIAGAIPVGACEFYVEPVSAPAAGGESVLPVGACEFFVKAASPEPIAVPVGACEFFVETPAEPKPDPEEPAVATGLGDRTIVPAAVTPRASLAPVFSEKARFVPRIYRRPGRRRSTLRTGRTGNRGRKKFPRSGRNGRG